MAIIGVIKMEIISGLLLVIFLSIATFFMRTIQKSWLSPGAFFLLVTTMFIFLPMIFAPYYKVAHAGLWWIAFSALALSIGSIIGMGIQGKGIQQELSIEFLNNVPFKRLRRWTLLFTAIGFLGLLYFINQIGVSLSVFTDFANLGNVSSAISHARYTGGYSQPVLYNVALSINYAAGFLGGILWVLKRSKISFFPFVPIIMATALTTTKSVIVFIAIFWIGGFIATKVLTKQYKLFTFKQIMSGILIVLSLNVLFIMFFMLRYNWTGFGRLNEIYEKLTHYYFGYLAAFTQWFKDFGYEFNELLWGQMTLAGVWDLLGVERAQGMYDKFIVIDPGTGKSTNIYTLYRFFIDDFGLIGSLLVFLVIGIIAGYAFKQVSRGRIIFMPILMWFYAQTIFSNTTSVLSYNTLLIAWLLVSGYIVRISIPGIKRVVISKEDKPKKILKDNMVAK